MNSELTQSADDFHASKAIVLLDLKRYKDAIIACTQAISSEPEEPANYYTLAQAYLGLGDNNAALEAAHRTIVLAPEWPAAYCILSYCLNRTLDFDGELYAAEHAALLDPEDVDILDRLARAQIQSGQLSKARETSLQLIQLAPEDGDVHSLVADISIELEDYETAETHIREALRQQPENDILHNDLGRIMLGKKLWREAIDTFFYALKLNPEEKTYQLNINIAIEHWLDSQMLLGKRRTALKSLPENILYYYEYKENNKTVFEKLDLFGSILIVLFTLIVLTMFFSSM